MINTHCVLSELKQINTGNGDGEGSARWSNKIRGFYLFHLPCVTRQFLGKCSFKADICNSKRGGAQAVKTSKP